MINVLITWKSTVTTLKSETFNPTCEFYTISQFQETNAALPFSSSISVGPMKIRFATLTLPPGP